MKGSGLFSVLSAILLLFAAWSSAWPWPEPNADALILARQEQRQTSTESAAATESSSSATSGSAKGTSSDESAATTGSASGTVSASGSGSKNSTKTTSTKTTPIDPRLPPGGISLITPAPIDGVQYYKIGDYVTWKWNYTSLSVTPSAIDVLASCSLNSATYTLTSNMSVEETGALTWDTGEFQSTATIPFPVASYTLIIHDSSKDITDIPSAGYLGAYEQFVFGMYTGQPYTPLNEFKCATCNGAFSIHEKQAVGVLLMTAAITVMSFTWFANGFGFFS